MGTGDGHQHWLCPTHSASLVLELRLFLLEHLSFPRLEQKR